MCSKIDPDAIKKMKEDVENLKVIVNGIKKVTEELEKGKAMLDSKMQELNKVKEDIEGKVNGIKDQMQPVLAMKEEKMAMFEEYKKKAMSIPGVSSLL